MSSDPKCVILLTSCEADNFFPQWQLRGSKAGWLMRLNKQIVSSDISKDCTITTKIWSNKLKLTQVSSNLPPDENSGLFKGSGRAVFCLTIKPRHPAVVLQLQLRLSGISLGCNYWTIVGDSRWWGNRTRTILHKLFLKIIPYIVCSARRTVGFTVMFRSCALFHCSSPPTSYLP